MEHIGKRNGRSTADIYGSGQIAARAVRCTAYHDRTQSRYTR
ncbi:hypothetical protein [uncultured Megasphaera sp.]|nr:hypothetical protein [uncultured Megasphaera sp.]